MYPEYLQLSLEKVAEKREANTALQPERMTAEEKDVLLKGFHPDYRKDQYTELRAGANKGDKVNTELAETLMGKSRIHVGDAHAIIPAINVCDLWPEKVPEAAEYSHILSSYTISTPLSS